jgi:alkanesulfonate monooxygenase SsuD/methylene tetrahydromethanopterin reductase-like flavin-dependent oxidoreductase (luciferase family)
MGARTAGRLGLGLQSIARELYEPYLIGLEAGGHDASIAKMAGQVEFFLSDDPERTWAEIGEHVVYRWNSYNRYMFEGTRRAADPPQYFDLDEILDRFLIGTAEQVAAAITERVAGLPVTDMYTWSDYPGIPDDLVDRHLELTFTQLAPRLRAL